MSDWIFIIGTAIVAYHGLTFRDENGEKEWGHLFFGAIAALFLVRALFTDILQIAVF